MATVHVVGSGLAGLASAVALSQGAHRIILYEAALQAGGRCRSYDDPVLDRRIDNGNHLLLGGNHAALRYLARTGASDSLTGPASALFPFLDLRTGARWALRWDRGRVPWWLLQPARRVPGTRLVSYLDALRLTRAPAAAALGTVVDVHGPLFARLIEPLAKAVLNTPAHEASAALFGKVLRETFGQGAAACRPLVARRGLSESFVEPALARLDDRATVRFGARLRSLEEQEGRCRRLDFGAQPIELAGDDSVVLAVPAAQAAALLPGLTAPTRHHAIVNAHFRLADRARLPGGSVLLGLIGGTAEWLFARDDVVSVTVSAADALAEEAAPAIERTLWRDVARALDLAPAPAPPCRIVKEKRATFAQTPDQVARRPLARTRLSNVVLAGDWTDTGLPATIEGAIRSGERAAGLILNDASRFSG